MPTACDTTRVLGGEERYRRRRLRIHRLLANPDGTRRVAVEGHEWMTMGTAAAECLGFTLAELAVLNRYRRNTYP